MISNSLNCFPRPKNTPFKQKPLYWKLTDDAENGQRTCGLDFQTRIADLQGNWEGKVIRNIGALHHCANELIWGCILYNWVLEITSLCWQKMYFTIMLESKLSEGYVVKNTQLLLKPNAPEVSVITHLLFICQETPYINERIFVSSWKQSQGSGWRDSSRERPELSMWKTLGWILCPLPQIPLKILLWLAFPLGIVLWGSYWICIKPSNVLYNDHWPCAVRTDNDFSSLFSDE